jgi:hypothetical protein
MALHTFKFNPTGGQVCPVCGTNTAKGAILVPVNNDDTKEQAVQVHTECILKKVTYYSKIRALISAAIYAPVDKDIPINQQESPEEEED